MPSRCYLVGGPWFCTFLSLHICSNGIGLVNDVSERLFTFELFQVSAIYDFLALVRGSVALSQITPCLHQVISMNVIATVPIRLHVHPWRVWHTVAEVGGRWRRFGCADYGRGDRRRSFSTSTTIHESEAEISTYQVECGASGFITVE